MRIAEALVARYPDLEVSRAGYGRGEPSASRCFEINDLGDDSFGVQIQLFDDEAFVTVPFWHTGEKAAACFAQVWDLMRLICGAAGYAVFDGQMDRALKDGETIDAALAAYTKAMTRVSAIRNWAGANRPSRGGRRSAEARIGRRGSGIGTAPDSAAATRRISSCNLLLTSGNVCYRFLCGKKAIAYMARIALRTPADIGALIKSRRRARRDSIRRSLRRWPASAGFG